MGKPIKFSDREKAWLRPRGKATRRAYRTRQLRERILIVCEGEKTEPNYFQAISRALPPHVAELHIMGVGANTLSLVRSAQELRNTGRERGYPYDQTWVVFDRDSFGPDDFDNAIHMANADDINCAWSNEAFELWYILHFEDRQSAMPRIAYQERLAVHLGTAYRKNAGDMFERLERVGDRAAAVRRAVALRDHHGGAPANRQNPCTHVDKLVGALMRFVVPR